LPAPRLKICGLRHIHQARAIAERGVDAIGVIGVAGSPRHLEPAQRKPLFDAVRQISPACLGVLVVADPDDGDLPLLAADNGHQVLQLHGNESPERCKALKERLGLRLWKALRIREASDLQRAWDFEGAVDALLLDAWVPDQLGGTGHRLPLEWLEPFAPPLPWWLAGGLRPQVIREVLQRVSPSGLDVSSGVEDAPGEKNLEQVDALIRAIRE
jgi:phosphoribosylanthranilate isomerase